MAACSLENFQDPSRAACGSQSHGLQILGKEVFKSVNGCILCFIYIEGAISTGSIVRSHLSFGEKFLAIVDSGTAPVYLR